VPIDRRFDEATGILWTTLRNGLTIEELREHITAVRDMAGHRVCEVVDTRDAEPLFSAKEFPALAKLGRQVFGDLDPAPRAVIVNPNDLVSFGLARLFSVLVAPWLTVRVFDNESAAVAFVEGHSPDRRRP